MVSRRRRGSLRHSRVVRVVVQHRSPAPRQHRRVRWRRRESPRRVSRSSARALARPSSVTVDNTSASNREPWSIGVIAITLVNSPPPLPASSTVSRRVLSQTIAPFRRSNYERTQRVPLFAPLLRANPQPSPTAFAPRSSRPRSRVRRTRRRVRPRPAAAPASDPPCSQLRYRVTRSTRSRARRRRRHRHPSTARPSRCAHAD